MTVVTVHVYKCAMQVSAFPRKNRTEGQLKPKGQNGPGIGVKYAPLKVSTDERYHMSMVGGCWIGAAVSVADNQQRE